MNKSLLTKAFSLSADSLLAGFFLLILVSTFGFAIRLAPVAMAHKQVLGTSSASELDFYLNTTSSSQFLVQSSTDKQMQIQALQLPAGVSTLSLAQIANVTEADQQFQVHLLLPMQAYDLLDFSLNFAGVSYELQAGESITIVAPNGLAELTLEIHSDNQINFPLEFVIELQQI